MRVRGSISRRTAWSVVLLLNLVGCSGGPDRDPADCRRWIEVVPELPERTRAPLEPAAPSACLVEGGVQVGHTRVPFAPARAGERLSAGLRAALPDRTRVVDLWADADRSARDVVLVTRAFGRAGVVVRLVGRREGVTYLIARIDPPRASSIPSAAGVVPDEVDVWVEMAPGRYTVRTTDGAHVPIERGPLWDELAERLREQREQAPDRRRLAFAPEEAVAYRDWAHALAIAGAQGFDSIELTPVGALEAILYEVGGPLLSRTTGLPMAARGLAVMPPEQAGDAERDGSGRIRSQVEIRPMDVGGAIDASDVEQVVREHLRELALCHERASTADQPLEGRVTLGILVSAAGRAQSVGVAPPADEEATIDDEPMLRCLRARVAQWTFAPRAHITGVRLPLRFRASAR